MAANVSVWVSDIGSLTARDVELLDPVERARHDALVYADDRARFALGVSLSRRAAAEALGIPPAAVRIDRRCARCGQHHGRPLLPGTGLHLSVSHSADLVAVALTAAGPVGIDVERLDPSRIAGAAALLVGPHKQAPSTPAEFFTTWCRKESAVKATGDGLRVALADVTVTPATEPPRLLRYPSTGTDIVGSSRMLDLPLAAGYAASLTALLPAPTADLAVDVRRV